MAHASAYNEKYHVDWAWSLALKGATDEEIAEAFHISVRTLHRWKKTHPELLTALEEGKDVADAKVKRSLYQRAVGYEAKEVTQIIEQDPATGFQNPSHHKAHRTRHDGLYVLAQQQKQGRVLTAAGGHTRRVCSDLSDGKADRR